MDEIYLWAQNLHIFVPSDPQIWKNKASDQSFAIINAGFAQICLIEKLGWCFDRNQSWGVDFPVIDPTKGDPGAGADLNGAGADPHNRVSTSIVSSQTTLDPPSFLPLPFMPFFFVILLRFRIDTTKSNELTWTLSLLPHDDCNIRLPQAKRSFIIWDNEPRPVPLKWGMWKKLMWENEEMRGGAIWDMGHRRQRGKSGRGFLFCSSG